ncbi:MAG: ABC transporter ATP-binding protein [Planctomyces sp.]|nr:ABC transporter ATP-binding protein [Planctomyces sp.]
MTFRKGTPLYYDAGQYRIDAEHQTDTDVSDAVVADREVSGHLTMQQFIRLGNYAWPYRRQIFFSIACALFVSAFWSLNLSITFPIVRVLFEGDSLHANVDREILEMKKEIEGYRQHVSALDEKDIAEHARLQRKINEASQVLLARQWTKDLILPYVPEDKFRTILLILASIVIATVLKGIFVYFQEILVGSLVNAASNDIRADVFSNAMKLDCQSLAGLGTSNLTSRLTNDVSEMGLGLRLFGADLVREPLKAVLCIMVAFSINWRLTAVGIIVLPLIGLLFTKSSRVLRKSSKRSLETMSSIYQCINESLDSFRIVLAFGRQERHVNQLKEANQEYYNRSQSIVRVTALVRPATELLGIVAFISILIPGAYMVLNETDQIAGIKLAARPLELAELATLYALLAGVLDPVRKMSGILPIMRRSMAAAERVFEVIDLKTIVPESSTPVTMPRHAQSITFDSVSFRYQTLPGGPSNPLSLNNVSFTVRFGEVVAVIGGNGSGKSTLTSLIPRMFDPTEGSIRIDGVDISEVALNDLRSQIGIVTQDTMLFDDTVYNNILYGRPDASHQAVEEAIRLSHAADFITTLPDGLNTRVGAKGQRLSGGQKQRIALARAILRNPTIMILDEATSAVDAESESLIHGSLRQFAEGRTTFIISHVINQTFLDLIDRIIVLDRGRIIAMGTHEELSRTSPDYLRMIQTECVPRKAA